MLKKMKTGIGLVLVTLFFLSACAGPYTVAVVVRHAEKQSGSNPALTLAGQQRAEELSDRLASLNITGVYSTNTQRTIMTAQPLADLKGVPVSLYTNAASAASTILSDHIGEAVLVVGHSNTVGNIITALGAELPDGLPQPINEDDFDNMVIVIVDGRGRASAAHSVYGVPSP